MQQTVSFHLKTNLLKKNILENNQPFVVKDDNMEIVFKTNNIFSQEHALKATERLGTVRKLDIVDGITIYNNNPKEGRSFEALSTDPEIRSKQITERLWESTSDLLQKSDLELSYSGGEEEDESRALGEGEIFLRNIT